MEITYSFNLVEDANKYLDHFDEVKYIATKGVCLGLVLDLCNM